MSETIQNAWDSWSDNWYQSNMTEDIVMRLKADPLRAFPTVVRDMLQAVCPVFAGKRILVPSSGDNGAVFAFHMLGAQVTSVDISCRQLENAKAIADENRWNIEFVCADSMSLDGISDGVYDLVYTSNGVHVWIDDLPAMHRSIHRILKPGGHYVMFEPHPINRPFDDAAEIIRITKPYGDIFVPGEPENYHWRIMDFVNSITGQGLAIRQMEEFTAEADSLLSLWWYKTLAEAETDGFQRFDNEKNPWVAMPQWMAFLAQKSLPRG